MTRSCGTGRFPSLSSYEEARKHFDSVKPWNSKYNPDNERPIGNRSCKLDHHDTRFNKAMRERDGSILFRLYEQDCVIWHPDNTLTVHGHATMSTTSFIDMLVPSGVRHQKGRKDYDEPVLHLRAETRPKSTDYSNWEEERLHWWAYWNSGDIIRADYPVQLHYNAETDRWEPVDWSALPPFHVPVLDRRLAREIAREYRLAKFEQLAKATLSLAIIGEAEPDAYQDKRFHRIAEALLEERYAEALRWCPRGQIEHGFTRRMIGTPDGILPGFLRRLRDHLYDFNGAIKREERVSMTPAQYRRYVTDSNRFD